MDKASVRNLTSQMAEYIFAVTPMVILTILILTKGRGREIYFTRDWSFISMLLLGQVITKFNTKLIPHGKRVIIESVALTNAIIICLIFIPSVIVFCGLSMIDRPNPWLFHAQALLFLLASVLFLTLTILPETIPQGDDGKSPKSCT